MQPSQRSHADANSAAAAAAKPCMMCNHPCPNTPCGVKAPCDNCGWPYPHGSCAD